MVNEKINNKNSDWLRGKKNAPVVDHPEVDEMLNFKVIKK